MPKLTHEKFIQTFKEVRPHDADSYTFLTKFTRGDQPITVKHSCGRIFMVPAGRLFWYDPHKNGTGGYYKCVCQTLAFGKSIEELQKKVDASCGDAEYKILSIDDPNEYGRYYMTSGPMRIQHKCGEIYKYVNLKVFLECSSSCSQCKKYACQYEYYQKHPEIKSPHQKIFVVSQIQDELDRVFGKDRYQCLNTTFERYDDPINVKCSRCGSVFVTNLHAILYDSQRYEEPGLGCPLCGRYTKFTQEKWDYVLSQVYNGEYKSVSPFVSYEEYTMIEHIPCHYQYTVIPHHFLSTAGGGTTCPICTKHSWSPGKRSQGEKTIERILTEDEIKFKSEFVVRPDDFQSTRCYYRYDFALLNANSEPYAFIEFDGAQHFQPVDMFGGEAKFQEIQESDAEKNKYCQDHDIPLLRIPYWDFDNIKDILEDFICKNLNQSN